MLFELRRSIANAGSPATADCSSACVGSGIAGVPLLAAEGLEKDFNGFKAISNVNLIVRENSIHGIIGPNGAGKTTLFNLLTKFVAPTRGKIFFRGIDVTQMAPAAIARLGVVRSFQISAVFPTATVRDNIRIALQRRAGLAIQLWRSDHILRQLDERAAVLADQVSLTPFLHEPAASLSYGRKRALEIATTLAVEPTVMLLDEPMAGMAREDIGRVTELIRKAAVGRTVVMVEHNLSVVENLCTFVTVLERGEVLCEGTYANVSADPRVRKAYLGTVRD